MKKTTIKIDNFPKNLYGQLKYAIFFIDENFSDVEMNNADVTITHDSDKTDIEIEVQVKKIADRFFNGECTFIEKIVFENRVGTPYKGNILEELFKENIIKQLEPGIFTYREPFTKLLRFLDDYFVKRIGFVLGAKEEYYPVTINGATLNKVGHFTSFPEHLLFVSHLKEDLDILDEFVEVVRGEGGWNEKLPFDYGKGLRKADKMINPATCYHCYEAKQKEKIDGDGTVVTACSKVYRYESKNHREYGRLMDFTLREVIFIGKPGFVKEKREAAVELLKDILKRWEIDCWLENANDPFFTNDFELKASYQRKQDMKFELRMNVPFINKSIAVFSSNFHGNVFATAFEITAGERPAITACIGFGLERWVFAFLAQYGLDEDKWPKNFKEDYKNWQSINNI